MCAAHHLDGGREKGKAVGTGAIWKVSSLVTVLVILTMAELFLNSHHRCILTEMITEAR